MRSARVVRPRSPSARARRSAGVGLAEVRPAGGLGQQPGHGDDVGQHGTELAGVALRHPVGGRPGVVLAGQGVDAAEDADHVRRAEAQAAGPAAHRVDRLDVALAGVGHEVDDGVGVAEGAEGVRVEPAQRVHARGVDDRVAAQRVVGRLDGEVGDPGDVGARAGDRRAHAAPGRQRQQPVGAVAAVHAQARLVGVPEPRDEPRRLGGAGGREPLLEQRVDQRRLPRVHPAADGDADARLAEACRRARRDGRAAPGCAAGRGCGCRPR